jgi:hypothetical protein
MWALALSLADGAALARAPRRLAQTASVPAPAGSGSNDSGDSSDWATTGVILGICVGGAALLILLVAGLCCCCRRSRAGPRCAAGPPAAPAPVFIKGPAAAPAPPISIAQYNNEAAPAPQYNGGAQRLAAPGPGGGYAPAGAGAPIAGGCYGAPAGASYGAPAGGAVPVHDNAAAAGCGCRFGCSAGGIGGACACAAAGRACTGACRCAGGCRHTKMVNYGNGGAPLPV